MITVAFIIQESSPGKLSIVNPVMDDKGTPLEEKIALLVAVAGSKAISAEIGQDRMQVIAKGDPMAEKFSDAMREKPEGEAV